MNDNAELTIDTIKNLARTEPAYRNFLLRASVHSGTCDYDEFIDALYTDLALVFQGLSSSSSHRNKDKEDKITEDIILNLKSLGWRASHDKSTNGHVDITIESTIYKWLGEAKRDKGHTKVIGGFDQLFSRYSNPYDYHVSALTGEKQNKAGILIYVQDHDNCAKYMREIIKKLKSHCEEKYTPLKERQIDEIIWETEHKHETSGTEIIVRHIPLMLYFNPKDR